MQKHFLQREIHLDGLKKQYKKIGLALLIVAALLAVWPTTHTLFVSCIDGSQRPVAPGSSTVKRCAGIQKKMTLLPLSGPRYVIVTGKQLQLGLTLFPKFEPAEFEVMHYPANSLFYMIDSDLKDTKIEFQDKYTFTISDHRMKLTVGGQQGQ